MDVFEVPRVFTKTFDPFYDFQFFCQESQNARPATSLFHCKCEKAIKIEKCIFSTQMSTKAQKM